MLKTAKGRYEEALGYLNRVNADLGADVERAIKARGGTFWVGPERAAGDELSISGRGHKKESTADHRKAIRALLLTQIAYFRTPYSPQDYASEYVLNITVDEGLRRTKQDIDNELLEYLPMTGVSHDDIAAAAERICSLSGVFDPVRYRRADTHLSSTPVCYHGVGTWLFSAGVVSKRWLARGWNSITAYTCNDILGDGEAIDQSRWSNIPRGWVWNIHRVNDKSTCHWGISLGNDISVACNNTDSSPYRTLTYQGAGNTHYGKFRFSEICDVLNGHNKYGHVGDQAPTGNNIVVRQFDPTRPPAEYY